MSEEEIYLEAAGHTGKRFPGQELLLFFLQAYSHHPGLNSRTAIRPERGQK